MEPLLDSLGLDDIRAGGGRWRNIQDSVRLAIASLISANQSQARTIHVLESKLDSLCSILAQQTARADEHHAQAASRIQVV
jgi:hypothetical protein